MFKKLLIVNALLALTGSAFAASPYVGAGLGVAVNTAGPSSSVKAYRGLPVSVFGGYGGLVTQNVYLAGEVFAGTDALELENYGMRSTYNFGASVLPGLMLNDH